MWSISWELSEFLSCESGVKEVTQMFGMAKWEVVEVVRSLATREACPSWIKFSLKKICRSYLVQGLGGSTFPLLMIDRSLPSQKASSWVLV